jgi:hypothetical protein
MARRPAWARPALLEQRQVPRRRVQARRPLEQARRLVLA